MKINKLSTFVGAILSKKPLIAGKSVQIELNENLIFGNYPQAIVSLLADFGEGKTHIFLKNGTYALHYATSGTKTIRLVGKFADGTEKTTYTRIEVQNDQSATARGSAVPPCYIRDGVNRIKSTIPFTPYVPELFATAPAEVELGYYYASNGTTSPCNSYRTLRKPILIIDGIDPQDKRKIIRDINNPDEPIIYDKLNYKDANGADGNLGEELRAQGYDVIVANFPSYRVGNLGSGPGPFAFPYYRDGGADYIERNAMGIIAVIQQLNSELPAGSTEKLVVFGPSMGGIIARYALAYMERNGLNHNTKLYASFDSPHNGSNISIGVQTFLTYMAYARNSASALQTVETELNNMTARQLLLSHHEAFVLTQNFGLFATPRGNILSSGVSPFRTTFVNNLNTIGFPTNLRKVAIASGAINGTKLINTVAGQEAAYMHIKCVQSAYGLLNGKSLAVANIHLAQGYGATDKIFRFAKKFQSSEPGFLGSVSTIINSGILGQWQEVIIKYTAPANTCSLDIAPGGTYPVFAEIKASIDTTNNSTYVPGYIIDATVTLPNAGRASFVPTKSALAFTGSNQDMGEALNNRSLVCSGQTPFDAYYGSNTNEEHTSLNTGNVAWILREINGNPNDNPPATPPSDYAITINHLTPGISCIGAKQRYSYNIPMGILRNGDIVRSKKWFVTGDLQIDGADDQPTVLVAPMANTGNIGTVRVEITTSNPCVGKGTATRIVYAGIYDYPIEIKKTGGAICAPNPVTLPDEPIPVDGPVRTYSLDLTPAYLAYIGTILTYSWSTTGGLSISGPTNLPTVDVLHTSNGTISLEITSNGLCIGKGRKTLAVNFGVPVMLSSATLYLGCGGVEAVFADGVTNISIFSFKNIPLPTIAYSVATDRVLFTGAGRCKLVATNSCGNSIIYAVTVLDPNPCKTVTQAPKTPEITISPNPANTYLDVTNILAGSEVKIYTKMGVLVHSQQSENDKIRLDISKLSTDLYILEAVLPNNVRVRKQIVKQ